jgi:hypothetical protein
MPLAELPGARRIPLVYEDLRDGSMAALLGYPELLLEPQRRSQTSFFERMERDHPRELRAGLRRIERELRAGDGSAPTRSGRASIVAWVKPSDDERLTPELSRPARKRDAESEVVPQAGVPPSASSGPEIQRDKDAWSEVCRS